jgi:hypothetical protein
MTVIKDPVIELKLRVSSLKFVDSNGLLVEIFAGNRKTVR